MALPPRVEGVTAPEEEELPPVLLVAAVEEVLLPDPELVVLEEEPLLTVLPERLDETLPLERVELLLPERPLTVPP